MVQLVSHILGRNTLVACLRAPFIEAIIDVMDLMNTQRLPHIRAVAEERWLAVTDGLAATGEIVYELHTIDRVRNKLVVS